MNSIYWIVVIQSLHRVWLFCDPIDCNPPGFFCPRDFPGKNTGVGCHFLLQGIFSTQRSTHVSCLAGRFSTWQVEPHLWMCVHVLSRIQLFVTPSTAARLHPLSMGFFRQEYWSGLPFPTSGDLHNPGTEPTSPASPVLAGRFFTISVTWEAKTHLQCTIKPVYKIKSILNSIHKKLQHYEGRNTFICTVWLSPFFSQILYLLPNKWLSFINLVI